MSRDLEQIRREIKDTKARLRYLESAPVPLPDVEARLDRLIADWAASVETSAVGGWVAGPNDPSGDILEDATPTASGRGKVTAILAFLDPARLKSVLMKTAKPHAGTVPLAERPGLRQNLEAELYALEVEEEQAVCDLEAQGVEVYRRPDIDPTIVLSVEEDG